MKVVIDTNVFVSGIFFTGPPYQILESWRDGRLQPVISQEIDDEYRSVGAALSRQYPAIDTIPIFEFVSKNMKMIIAPDLPEPICVDPDDDKFIACALAAGCKIIVSGDKHLLNVSGFCGIQVLKPRDFVDRFLTSVKER
ncbi:MAG: putative toxin-antitoxin system toxin component, PIN family [Deltaproteobacteria bacterium]|jgi:putative PIN family toxin of toxin-antitoxin system